METGRVDDEPARQEALTPPVTAPTDNQVRESSGRYSQPQFLSQNDDPGFRVRCPIHGFIRFSRNERQVIDHRVFQRLRYIRQLALTELLYPGATHTRFEHSLGVMEVATQVFDRLAAKHGSVLESTFATVDAFRRMPLAIARQAVRLAALLHDVGHAAFSHAAEDVIPGGGHEALSVALIREDRWLGALIRAQWGDAFPSLVASIIDPPADFPLQLQVLHDIVSGVMDADRTDYLRRDSYHCGVDYGRFDHRRLIESLELQLGSEPALEIALHRDGIHAFEGLILARYQMSTQVSYHRLRRLYDLYLTRYHQALGPTAFDSADKVIAENDTTMMARIMRDAREDNEAGKWASRICDRRHHKLIHDTGANADAQTLRQSKQLFTEMQKRYDQREFLFDSVAKSIHDLEVPGDVNPGRVLMLVGPDGDRRRVTHESQILATIPRRFQVARIFADLGPNEVELRADMHQFAKTTWHHLREGV
jgi:uncharacterized protein